MKTTKHKIITLTPNITYFLIKNFWILIFAIICCIVAKEKYINYEYTNEIIACLFIFSMLTSLYNFVNLLFFTKWIVTEEQIKIIKGIFVKNVNYIELYRIVDYEEKQSFLQRIFVNKNIYIYSGDKSNPKLCIYGLNSNIKIISIIRNRVEKQKIDKQIYEITNRI